MENNFEPFESAEEVWFWFCSSMEARNEGWRIKGDFGGKERCCEVNDIYRIIKKIKLQKLINNRHLRVMSEWGMKMISPYCDKRAKKSELKLWTEGINALSFYLIEKGII